jgi:prevent-host-death family protein
MTSNDYHLTMTSVGIAELKSRLSEHLRAVRRGGTITILDRNTPIARIVPLPREGESLQVRMPLPGTPKLAQVALPPPLRRGRDIVGLLLEDRHRDR